MILGWLHMRIKLFLLEIKDNDLRSVAYENREMMNKILASGMKPELPLATFLKSLYSTHSKYVESQATDKLKDHTFNTLVEKIANREKSFRMISSDPAGKRTRKNKFQR